MKNCSEALAAHLAQPTATVTTCWKITRMDGKVFTFTELDRDVTYGGLVYKSTGGFNKSAIKSTGTFSVDNLEVNGFLSDDTIPDEEVKNGAFDYAEVEVFLINYMNPSMGDLKLRYGFFGEVKAAPSGAFIVELRGLIQLLSARIGETYTPECRADLGDERCTLKITPDVRQSGTLYHPGNRVLVPVASPEEWNLPIRLSLYNGDFETGGLLDSNNNDWVTNLPGSWPEEGNINLDPYLADGQVEGNNTYFLVQRHDYANVRQTVSLLKGNSTDVRIDAGGMTVKFSAVAAALELSSAASVQLVFQTAGGGTIERVTKDFGILSPHRYWKKLEFEAGVPAGSRQVQVYLSCYNNDPLGVVATCWDNVRLDLSFPPPSDADFSDYRVYGGIEFEATVDGQTSNVPPNMEDWDTTPDATTTDGLQVWKAVTPRWMFLGQVTEDATLSHQFKCSALPVPSDDHLTMGVVEFLSGPNVGRAVEVGSYTPDTDTITLLMPLPYPSSAGDAFRVHAGCDKSIKTCADKFENWFNFRGEPDVPGLNQYFKVAGLNK